jgi:hypothetical protein
MLRFRAGTAVAIGVFLVGCQAGASSSSEPGSEPPASVAPSEASSPSEPAASIAGEISLPEGPFAWFDPTAPLDPEFDDGPPITVTIPASGWIHYPEFGPIEKGEEVDYLVESRMLWTSTTAGVLVYGDPCQWASTTPDTPATTAEAVAAALAAQPGRDASGPVDVTIGGYAAKRITLHVPDDLVDTECSSSDYASYTLDGYGAPWRDHQARSEIDTFWIVGVDGAIVIIEGIYRPDTTAERIEEMRSIAESATFE